ncbi:MAG: LTA synthase family protein [Allosphingosinicella sp.]
MWRAAPATGAANATGRTQFAFSLLLAAAAWLACALLQVALYVRPAPYGGPFLAEWQRYFGLALYYELLGVWLLSLPFFLTWLILFRRPLAGRAWRVLHFLQLGLLTANLLLSQIDHEILRFLGVRLNLSFLAAYAQPQMLTDRLFVDLLADDRGGPFVSLLLLALVPGLYLWWGLRRLRQPMRRAGPALWFALALAVVLPAVPAQSWAKANGLFRLRKIEPVALALGVDALAGFDDRRAPPDLDRLIRDYQDAWLARSTDPGWRFPDPHHPYVRVPTAPPPPAAAAGRRWNILYFQLETFRGADMGFLRPDRRPTPTPFLDGLAARPDAAVWTRTSSFGMPSINGLFATHCSVAPPSQRYITGFTHTGLLCLPELLRARGYRTEMFNGGDTDWDNSSPWIRRWYDRLWRFPKAEQRDRDIFRAVAPQLRRLGRSGQPFLAAVVSVSNHAHFATREPALDIAGHATPAERILNTTHYTDDVVRELLDGLRDEPWMASTLIVIVGDHGYNAGEHGAHPGRHDLYRESVWVPLIIAGPHPRLPAGRHELPATLLDVAPTLADLLGLRIANPWQGHSLLAVNGRGALGFAFRDSLLSETPDWAAVRDPVDGRVRLYDSRRDWLQRHDLAGRRPELARRLLQEAERSRRRHDFLLRQARIWPRSAS